MKKYFKSIFALALVIVISSALVACRNKKGGSTETDWELTKYDAQTEGSITFGIFDNETEEEISLEMVSAFNKKFPKIKVNIERVTGGSYAQSLMGYIFSGTMPDVFYLTDEDVSVFASKKIACDISIPYNSYSGLNREDVVESMLNIGKYKNGLYMLPRDYNKITIAYNKDLFDQYGRICR